MAGLAAFTAALCALAYMILPDAMRGYFIGAAGASAAWWLHITIIEMTNLANKRIGADAEFWTSDVLRRMRRRGWEVVNHVMLEHRDVDHVLLGPGGFYAVETKYSAQWWEADVRWTRFAAQVRGDAVAVHNRLGRPTHSVTPLVVLWGPNVERALPDPIVVDGVTFVRGGRLREYLATCVPTTIQQSDIDESFTAMAKYVRSRDVGELEELGAMERSLEQVYFDLCLALFAGFGAFAVVVQFLSIPPLGLMSALSAALVIIATNEIRKRSRASARSQRVTAAAIAGAAAGGIIGLLAAVLTSLGV